MGLGCKQVSSDALNWSQSLLQTSQGLDIPFPKEQTKTTNQGKRQHQQQQQETLKCPRCDSTNTKFCYYNNYNQSQPRHFCKTCKRHWTKGGTLRNVPVGGVRKTKRPKRTTTPTTPIQELNNTDQQFLPSDQNNNTFSGVLYNSSPLLRPSNCPNNNTDINYNMSANGFMGPVPLSPLLLSLPCFPSQTTTNHPYEDSSSFNLIPDPFFENRKQSQLLFPHASVEEGQIPVSMPWQVPATSFTETTHDTSFWNTGDIWALLSNVGIGSDAQQEEKNTPEKQQELDELV